MPRGFHFHSELKYLAKKDSTAILRQYQTSNMRNETQSKLIFPELAVEIFDGVWFFSSHTRCNVGLSALIHSQTWIGYQPPLLRAIGVQLCKTSNHVQDCDQQRGPNTAFFRKKVHIQYQSRRCGWETWRNIESHNECLSRLRADDVYEVYLITITLATLSLRLRPGSLKSDIKGTRANLHLNLDSEFHKSIIWAA